MCTLRPAPESILEVKLVQQVADIVALGLRWSGLGRVHHGLSLSQPAVRLGLRLLGRRLRLLQELLLLLRKRRTLPQEP